MKLAVSGKGGVGKTALAAGLARWLADHQQKVLALDADPDQNLAHALAFPPDMVPTPIGAMKDAVDKLVGQESSVGFRLNPDVSELADQGLVEFRGVRLMVMGTPQRGGGGCMCRPNSLVRSLVAHMILERDEHVVLDLVAGIEHLGRGTASGVNVLLVVVEPQRGAIETAGRVRKLASELGIPKVVAVANKVRSDADLEFIRESLGDLPMLGSLRYSPSIVDRVPPTVDVEFMTDVGSIAAALNLA